MRVGYDWGPQLDPPTGVGRYTAELAAALELRGIELTRYAVALRGRPSFPVAVSRPTPGARGGVVRDRLLDHGVARQRRLPRLARWRLPARFVQLLWRRLDHPAVDGLVGDVDVVHATNFVLPSLRRIPGVVTVHDLSFLRDDVFPGGERLRDLVPWSIERAAAVIAPSNAVAGELTERYPSAAGKVAVTPEAVASDFFGATPLSDQTLATMGIRRPFVLAAGTLEPRKNLRRLLEAWRHVSSDLEDWTLVIAGPRGWGPDLPGAPRVVLTGWLGDETLPGLLAAADVFCYPSLYEGFGLPPLEAMATGTPVIAGDHAVSREVLGDAAWLVDPVDTEAIANALVSVAADRAGGEATGRAVAGRARAASFTWEATALATIRAYRFAMGEGDLPS